MMGVGLCTAVCPSTFLFGGVVLSLMLYYFNKRHQKKIKRKLGKPNLPLQFGLKNLVAPTFTGWPLLVAGWLLRLKVAKPLTNMFLRYVFRQSNGDLLHKYDTPDPPTFLPVVSPTKLQEQHQPSNVGTILSKSFKDLDGFSFLTITELVRAYRTGKTTPLQVTENALAAIEKAEKLNWKLRSFVQVHKDKALMMAQESTRRYAQNKPLSIVDGIPVGLKEDYEVVGYHIRCGTTFLGEEPEEKDCNIVVKLRQLGCVILGLTNMHEIGAGTTGNNPNHLHGTPHNPYNLNYHPGGSSSGSACAVAAGFCPVTLGRDGGGSIRIPSAICGVVGIKATYGRITSQCDNHFGGYSVGHPGPICATVSDTAIMFALLSGRDEDFEPGLIQPEHATLEDFENVDLTGLKIGIHWQYVELADQNVLDVFKKAVEYLKSKGASIKDIIIPELEELRVAHFNIIGSELIAGIENVKNQDKLHEMNPDTTFVSAIFGNVVRSVDYILAARQRTRSIAFMKSIFSDVDCILTPATGCTPVEITDTYERFGFSSPSLTGKVMRYMQLGNFTGIPGMVVPFGYDHNNLPIGVQVMTSWWEEHVAFRVAHCLEKALVRREPQVYFNILDPNKNIIPQK